MADIASAMAAGIAASQSAAAPATKSDPAPKTETKPEKTNQPDTKAAAPTPAEKKIWKLKADGEEFEFDASDEEAVKREIMKARGANKRFEEAAQQRKQAEQFFNMLKDPANLAKVLSDPRIGVDVKKWAQDQVWADMQEQALTPEQRRQREVDAELKRYKDQEAKAKAEAEAQQAQQLQAHYEADFEAKILTALQSGGVPNTKGAVRRMAAYMQMAIQNNLDIQPADLVAQVRKDLIDEHREMYSTADGDTLMSILGEDLAKKIRNADVKRLKSTQPDKYKREATSTPRKAAETKTKMSPDEWSTQLKNKMLGRQ